MACPGGWKAFGTKIKFRMNDIWLKSQKVNKRRKFAIPSKFDLDCRRKRKVNEELKLEKFFEQGLAYSVFSVILTEVHSLTLPSFDTFALQDILLLPFRRKVVVAVWKSSSSLSSLPTMSSFEVVLLRHGESAWNNENLFCGWVDVDLR